MSDVTLERLEKRYGSSLAVAGIDLAIAHGELVALLGPSGCGKTTTLRMVAGFVAPSAGRVLIGERDVTTVPPYARDTGMVFQGFSLFPHMTVAENVGFGLEMRKVTRGERERRVTQALSLVQLTGFAARRPGQLSGGQQQRVALARALVINPAVFLLDEPLSALDAALRGEMRAEIRSLQQRLGLTTLFVTHDQEEALTMADRLVVMDRGRVRQVGTPREVYERPADLFVARFLGACNVIEGSSESPGRFRAAGHLLPCAGAASGTSLAVRPERIEIAPQGAGLPGRVAAIVYSGGQTQWVVETDAGTLRAIAPTPRAPDPRAALAEGDPVSLAWPQEAGLLLPLEPTGDDP